MNVLILGGSGFIGSHVIKALAARGITAIAPPHRGVGGVQDSRCLDATDVDHLDEWVSQADAVVNCVSGSAGTIRANARALFVAAARQRRAPHVVYLSSMAVYGDASGVVREDAPVAGATAYAEAKLEAERLARGYGRAVVLRPGCVYGAGSRQWSQRIATLVSTGRLGDLGEGGAGRANLLHVQDLATAIVRLTLDTWQPGEAFNLAAPAPPRWNDYFRLLALRMGVRLPHVAPWRLMLESRVVAPALKAVQIAGSALGLNSQALPEPLPPSLVRLFRQDIVLDASKAQSLLGLSFTSLDEGVRTSIGQADVS